MLKFRAEMDRHFKGLAFELWQWYHTRVKNVGQQNLWSNQFLFFKKILP